jgi:hypothetical protein
MKDNLMKRTLRRVSSGLVHPLICIVCLRREWTSLCDLEGGTLAEVRGVDDDGWRSGCRGGAMGRLKRRMHSPSIPISTLSLSRRGHEETAIRTR